MCAPGMRKQLSTVSTVLRRPCRRLAWVHLPARQADNVEVVVEMSARHEPAAEQSSS